MIQTSNWNIWTSRTFTSLSKRRMSSCTLAPYLRSGQIRKNNAYAQKRRQVQVETLGQLSKGAVS